MASTFFPIEVTPDNRPVYEVTCETCGARCFTWSPRADYMPTTDELRERLGQPNYCDRHAPPPAPVVEEDGA